MAKTRWVNVSFPAGGHFENYKGFEIHEIELYVSMTGATSTEFGIFRAQMQIVAHEPSLAGARSLIDALVASGYTP